eukprot:365847-Chlamydomonas_euryale.AAC.6
MAITATAARGAGAAAVLPQQQRAVPRRVAAATGAAALPARRAAIGLRLPPAPSRPSRWAGLVTRCAPPPGAGSSKSPSPLNPANGKAGDSNGAAAGSTSAAAAAAAAASKPGLATVSMQDVSVSPLKVALEFSEAKLHEATALREALEAEAQRVAEGAKFDDLADGQRHACGGPCGWKHACMYAETSHACRRHAHKPRRVWPCMRCEHAPPCGDGGCGMPAANAARESVTGLQQAQELSVPADQGVSDQDSARTVPDALDEALQKDRVKALEEATAALSRADAAAASAEEVAAAAMKACEVAVKEEMQARAVVKETQVALEKAIQAISDEPSPGTAASPGSLASVASMSTSIDETIADVSPAALLGSELPTSLSIDGAPPTKPIVRPDYKPLIAAGAAAILAYAFVTYTPAGASVRALLEEKIGTLLGAIHVHGPELALLEAIIMLATSIICVPAVVSLIPGVHIGGLGWLEIFRPAGIHTVAGRTMHGLQEHASLDETMRA